MKRLSSPVPKTKKKKKKRSRKAKKEKKKNKKEKRNIKGTRCPEAVPKVAK